MFKLDDWLDRNKRKQKTVAEILDTEIAYTLEEIGLAKMRLEELEKDLASYNRFKKLIGDKEFKTQREFAKYILSLDDDIMKDYERLYGEKIV